MRIETLGADELALIRPLLLDLLQSEPLAGSDSPLSRRQLDAWLPRTRSGFQGENHILAAREGEHLRGFCWCVIYDPGTGLEGEVAELFVVPEERRQGLAGQLLEAAVELFSRRRVTFACVWTSPGNEAALRAYRKVGFRPTDQLVLTWYP